MRRRRASPGWPMATTGCVCAIDDALEGYDAARAFALRARLEPPRAATPRAATLSWEQGAAAAGYRLQVRADAASGDLAGEWDSPVAVDTAAVPGLIGGGSPPCAVRASGARGATSSPYAAAAAPGPVALNVSITSACVSPGRPGAGCFTK